MMKRKECVLIAIFLLVLALFAPLLLFYFQDKVRMDHITVKDKEGLSISSFSTSYELNLQKRLTRFVEGERAGKESHVTQMEPGTKKEAVDLVNKAMGQEILSQLVDSGYNAKYLGSEKEFSVYDWKRYAYYCEADKNGVVLIVEYVKIVTSGDLEMELLIDAKTADIYYLTLRTPTIVEVSMEQADAPVKKEQMKVIYPNLYYYAYMLYSYYSGGDYSDDYFDIYDLDEEEASFINEIFTEDTLYMNFYVKLQEADLRIPVAMQYDNGNRGYVGIRAGLEIVWSLIPESRMAQELNQ